MKVGCHLELVESVTCVGIYTVHYCYVATTPGASSPVAVATFLIWKNRQYRKVGTTVGAVSTAAFQAVIHIKQIIYTWTEILSILLFSIILS